MDATIHDLRNRMSSVLDALDRREEVHILYEGKPKWKIVPECGAMSRSVQDHVFFGSRSKDECSVSAILNELRSKR